MKSVKEFKAELKGYIEQHSAIIAAWEGGSVATGFEDEFSDLDLQITIEEVEPDEVFTFLENFFGEYYGIERKFRVPEPSWHGFSQAFYLLKNLPNLFYCDVCVIMADNQQKFTEPDRHGNSFVWFDKKGVYTPKETPKEAIEKLIRSNTEMVLETDWLVITELRKGIARKSWISAQRNYMQFINRHLAVLLNRRYDPNRIDFGIRYAERYYPREAVEQLEDFLKVSSLEEIKEKLPKLLEMYEALK